MADQTIQIADLRPTQLTLGFGAVEKRKTKLAEKSDAELANYLAEDKRRVPHVIGPGGRLYMTDHHHLARALWALGKREVVLGERLADLSHLDERAFWVEMDHRALCWPIDADGVRHPYASIPHHISELTDDPWRSLARDVRDKAFADLDTAFQEFMWGDYFRTFMTRRLLETAPDVAADLAVKVARLSEAQDLPGFKD
jgi:hypothetical protein